MVKIQIIFSQDHVFYLSFSIKIFLNIFLQKTIKRRLNEHIASFDWIYKLKNLFLQYVIDTEWSILTTWIKLYTRSRKDIAKLAWYSNEKSILKNKY